MIAAARRRGPRIGRADILAAARVPVETSFTAPPEDLDQVAAIARHEAASLARLTQLIGSVGRPDPAPRRRPARLQ
jgi:hypothetical protein